MKTLKSLLISLILLLSLYSISTAEYFTDIIMAGTKGNWTDSRAFTTINDAVTAIGSNERTLVISSPQSVTTLTIPSNITLQFEKDGSINNSGQLTINTTNIIAPNRQIFTGVGDIDFASGSIIKTGWFSNIESAFALTADDTITLIVSKPQTITASYSPGNNVHLKWESPDNILTVNAGVTVDNINQIDAGNYQLFAGAGNFRFLDGTSINLDWFSNLRAAITYASTNNLTLLVQGTHTIDFSDTTPSTLSIKISQGGIFAIPTGVTLTINGSFEAGLYQVFNCTGTGNIGGLKESFPEWWYTGTGSWENAFNSAWLSLNTKGGRIFLQARQYTIAQSWNLLTSINTKDLTIIEGISNRRLQSLYEDNQSTIKWVGGTDDVIIDIEGNGCVQMRNITIQGDGKDNITGIRLRHSSASNLTMSHDFDRVYIHKCTRGVVFGDSTALGLDSGVVNSRWNGCIFDSNVRAIFIDGSASDLNEFNGCLWLDWYELAINYIETTTHGGQLILNNAYFQNIANPSVTDSYGTIYMKGGSLTVNGLWSEATLPIINTTAFGSTGGFILTNIQGRSAGTFIAAGLTDISMNLRYTGAPVIIQGGQFGRNIVLGSGTHVHAVGSQFLDGYGFINGSPARCTLININTVSAFGGGVLPTSSSIYTALGKNIVLGGSYTPDATANNVFIMYEATSPTNTPTNAIQIMSKNLISGDHQGLFVKTEEGGYLGFHAGSGVTNQYVYTSSLIDNATVNLLQGTQGLLFMSCGTESGVWSINIDGGVVKLTGTTNTADTELDNNLCVFDGGSYAIVKNMLGTTKTITFKYLYTSP